MKRLIVLLCALSLLSARAEAAITVVSGQEATGSGNVDYTLTFPSAWGASNHVLVASAVYGTTISVSLLGASGAVTTLHHDNTLQGNTRQIYVWCFPGDGLDNQVTVDMSAGGTQVRTAAIEISGGSCTEDGTSTSNNVVNNTSQDLSSSISLQSGSIIFGIIGGASATTDFSAGSGVTSVPADGTDIGTVALGGYQIAGSTASYTLPFTSATNSSNAWIGAAAVQAGGGSPPASTPCVIGGGIVCGGAQ